MKTKKNIGVITFYKTANFGANIQAISTYKYLEKNGFKPIFINYMSEDTHAKYEQLKNSTEWKGHIDTVNSVIKNQTEWCRNAEQILSAINAYGIDAIIIGSDALLQHHTMISRLRKGKRKPLYVIPVSKDRMFPNLFWGCGFSDKLPVGLLSVSSQNSSYHTFSFLLKYRMKKALNRLKYISVRDTWTFDMVKSIDKDLDVKKTPDPVFGFNYNANDLVEKKDVILSRYGLPNDYVLVSLFGQVLSFEVLSDLKNKLADQGKSCVCLHMPTGKPYRHPFDFEIKAPLPSLDWYALIKYSYGYIGNNMHPIVVSLHNAVRCFSIDNWGRQNFWGHKVDDGSSKIEDIMKDFGVQNNHRMMDNGICNISASEIVECLNSFPIKEVRKKSEIFYENYKNNMFNLTKALMK